LLSELSQANTAYSEKAERDANRQKEMVHLAWKIKELSELNDQGRSLHSTINVLIAKLAGECSWIEDNIPSQLKSIRQEVATFIKGVTRHQRTPATHVLVFMISSEDRNKKPYALPVQCIPYKGLSDLKVRQLANKIIHEMSARNMKVAGKCHYLSEKLLKCGSCRFHNRWGVEFPSDKRKYQAVVCFPDSE